MRKKRMFPSGGLNPKPRKSAFKKNINSILVTVFAAAALPVLVVAGKQWASGEEYSFVGLKPTSDFSVYLEATNGNPHAEKSDATKRAQCFLVLAGEDVGKKGADGYFEDASEKAAANFQHATGLEITGTLDPDTLGELSYRDKYGFDASIMNDVLDRRTKGVDLEALPNIDHWPALYLEMADYFWDVMKLNSEDQVLQSYTEDSRRYSYLGDVIERFSQLTVNASNHSTEQPSNQERDSLRALREEAVRVSKGCKTGYVTDALNDALDSYFAAQSMGYEAAQIMADLEVMRMADNEEEALRRLYNRTLGIHLFVKDKTQTGAETPFTSVRSAFENGLLLTDKIMFLPDEKRVVASQRADTQAFVPQSQ